jgi:hypothetical protein
MKHGDLSSAPVPRFVVVFENGIGTLPDSRRAQWRKLARKGRWDDVAALFDLSPMMLRKITDLTFRHNVSVDVVTYCGPVDFAAALARRFDAEHVPVRIVQASTPDRMARRTSFEPDIVAVYDGNPEHAMVYGRKGKPLQHWSDIGT